MLHVLLVSTSEKTTGILKEYLNMEDCMTVSYTHLAHIISLVIYHLTASAASVSYTHLDVYKRQSIWRVSTAAI